MPEKWIGKMHMKEGVFANAAKRAGMSTAEFAEKHKADSGTLGRRARLAQTFAKIRPHADGAVVSPADSKPAESSRFSRLIDILMMRPSTAGLTKAGTALETPISAPSQDTSGVRRAAEQAAERMRQEKERTGQTPRSFGCGGVIGRYGK